MAETRRCSILKRFAAGAVAAVVLLGLYAASAPFVGFWLPRYVPAAVPLLQTLYAPTSVYAQHRSWPGSIAYNRYESWCYARLSDGRDTLSRKLDNERSDVQFNQVALSDVSEYLSRLHECLIELDESADPSVVITLTANSTFRDVLERICGPHGLVAAPIGERIVIGTPERIQQLTASSRPDNPLLGWAVGLPLLVGLFAAVLIFRRRKRRAT